MSKINLGVFILSNGWGGAEESTANIIENVDKEKFNIFILTNDFLADRYASINGVTVINLGGYESNKPLQKIYSLFKIQIALKKAIKKYSIDVLHARLENSLLSLGTMLPQLSVPIVFTLSGDEARMYQRPRSLEQRLIQKIIHRYIHHPRVQVTSVSQWLIRDFSEKDKEQIVVTPNGTNGSLFRPLPGVEKPDIPFVFYTGRLVKGKGIEDLVEVAKALPQYEFWFAGKGPLSELLTLPNTKHLGFVMREDLVALYTKSTICVFPSYAEGMPMSGIEAMACGKAVVASPAGFSDFIDNGVEGLIIEAGNVTQITAAIDELITNNKKRRRMEQAALEKAEQYDICQTVKNYEDLYLQMANR